MSNAVPVERQDKEALRVWGTAGRLRQRENACFDEGPAEILCRLPVYRRHALDGVEEVGGG